MEQLTTNEYEIPQERKEFFVLTEGARVPPMLPEENSKKAKVFK